MSVTRSNHCVYDTHYHVVFPVKYRYLATVSERANWQIVERYVANQGKGKTDTTTQLKLWR
jgi:hypothetical protein